MNFDETVARLGHPDHVHLPILLERQAVATDATPATWQYESIRPHFTIWGYDVTVERDVEEPLELTTVRTPSGGVHVVDLGDGGTQTIGTT